MRFRRLATVTAAVGLCALVGVAAGSAPGDAQGVPSLPLPAPPPPAANPVAGRIFDAMLAIGRAAVTNPQAAQTATFSYNAAIQQYNAGDLARAQQSALQAISQTGAVPFSTPAPIPPPALPEPSTNPMPRLTNITQAESEEFLALARRSIQACQSVNAPETSAAQRLYGLAVQEHNARQWLQSRQDAQRVVDTCAASMRQLNQQQAAPLPAPSAPSGLATPEPVATNQPRNLQPVQRAPQ